MSPTAKLHRPTFWICLAALTLNLIGGLGIVMKTVAAGTSAPSLEREATTDPFLAILGIPHPASAVRTALGQWSEQESLLFVAPLNDPFWKQVYFTLGYLAYPRRLSAMVCAEQPDRDEVYDHGKSSKVGGLILFDMPPGPWAGRSRQIGSKLYLVTYQGVAPWKSFCR